MKNILRAALIASTGLAMTACGTIVNGSSQSVNIHTEPAGAEVVVDGITRGQTPTKVKLTRKEAHVITLRKEGYQPQTVTLDSRFSGWFFGNLLFGGPVGMVVDAVTGGGFKLDEDSVTTHLTQEPVNTAKA